jgi:DNA-binding response OmpR family regulator
VSKKKEVQAGIDMGAAGYVRKPYDKEELFAAIQAAFQNTKGG